MVALHKLLLMATCLAVLASCTQGGEMRHFGAPAAKTAAGEAACSAREQVGSVCVKTRGHVRVQFESGPENRRGK